MESATKNRQKFEDIVKMVQNAFGSGIAPEEIRINELTEGYFNVAYQIELPGQEAILKIAPAAPARIMTYEKNIMQAEVDALRMVKKQTPVPVPKVLYYDNSKSACNADYFFMEKLDGESFYKLKCNGMPEEEQKQILTETGRLNKQINEITGGSFGYIGRPEKQGPDWKDTFLAMISEVLDDGERIEISLGIDYGRLRSLIESFSPALGEVKQPSLVHWDIWDGNVFVKDRKVEGIIDFERALWGDPLMEYYFRRHSCNECFNRGYGANLRQEAPVRALLYDIYLYLIMVIETKYRSYPDDGQYRFAAGKLSAAAMELENML